MIETLQVESELEEMLALYRERAPVHALEIGVWQGGTLRRWLADAAPSATVVAVDPKHPNADVYDEWRREGGADVAIAIWGLSEDKEVARTVEFYGPYDWVFIDGDHSLEAVRHDVQTYSPMIRQGGCLLLHDIVPPDGEKSYPPGEVFAALKGKHLTRAIVSSEPSDVSHGIGVVFL